MGVIRRSVGLSAASKYTQFLISLASNVVIARLLTPSEIGVYAVAAVLAGIAQLFRDLGIAQYLIRERELNETKLRVAFTLMTVMAWTLGGALVLAAEPIGAFYEEAELAEVLRIQALCFLVIPFGAINLTLLKRDFQFGATYLIDLGSNMAHLATAISLAVLGLGAQALAWASVVAVLASSVGAIIARRGSLFYRPTLSGAREVLAFGGIVTLTRILGSLSRDIPELMVGKALGTPALAFFSKALLPATMFSKFVMGALNPVLLPAFSRKHHENDLAGPFLHALSCVAALLMPSLVLLAGVSEWVVMLLFGSQWGMAAEPMRILALATAFSSVSFMLPSLFIALGYPRAPLNAQLLGLPIRLALIAVAMPYGLVAVAWAWLVSGLVGGAVHFFYLKRLADVSPLQVLRAVSSSVWLGCSLAALIGAGVQWLAPSVTVTASLGVLASTGALLAIVWFAGMAWLRHPLFVESTGLLAAVRRRRAASGA